MFRVLVGLVVVGLMVYSLADLSSSEEEDRGGLPTWLWVVIIVLLPVFGPIAWIVTKRARRNGGGRTARPGRGPRRPSGPVAPDDDPDFLWRIEQEKRRQQRRDRGEGSPDDTGDLGSS
ncbi:PLD nuclease N-terminal domain-containing protein [Isoptericola aurantiacus]|uniref:PLD nuclease N-terminal domain-containing protein n=1 Tax=Isoptericola aurantiacus TaxID=3377839 RepID=UPI00383B0823